MEDQDVFVQPERQPGVMPLGDLTARMRYVQELKDLMVEGVHYGRIPGIAHPSLWKPGAEFLCAGFQLLPQYEERFDDLPENHLRVRVKCRLFHMVTGKQEGEGIAVCSSMESKYRYRQQERVCPKCGKAAIIKGRPEYGGGWVCLAKKGGCGAKFTNTDKAIVDQVTGLTDNPDVADSWNTIAQMSTKRALVSATLVATAASEFFTQDDDSDYRPSEPAVTEEKEKRLETRPKPEEKPAASPAPQPRAKGELVETLGTITAVLVGAKVSQVHVRVGSREPTALFFRLDKLPVGMPAQEVGGHWQYLVGKRCTAKVEPVPNATGTTILMLREIHVDLPAETKTDFREKMAAKYPGPGLLDENQKQALLKEVSDSSLTTGDFDAFLLATYQQTIDTLPANQYANVREHLTSGFATQWCFDNGPTASQQASA